MRAAFLVFWMYVRLADDAVADRADTGETESRCDCRLHVDLAVAGVGATVVNDSSDGPAVGVSVSPEAVVPYMRPSPSPYIDAST